MDSVILKVENHWAILVVVCLVFELMAVSGLGGEVVGMLNLVVVSIAVPLFAICCGFECGASKRSGSVFKLLCVQIVSLVSLLVFSSLSLLMFYLGSTTSATLLSLIFSVSICAWFWFVSAPVLEKFQVPIFVMIFMPIVLGMFDLGYVLNQAMTPLCLLPFFILGFKIGLGSESVKWLIDWPYPFCIAILVINVLVWVVSPMFPVGWLLGDHVVKMYGGDLLKSGLVQIGVFAVSFFSAFSIFSLVSGFPEFLDKSKSAAIYVWGGVMVQLLLYVGLFSSFGQMSLVWVLLCAIFLSVVISFALSTNPFVWITRHFTKIGVCLIFKITPTRLIHLLRA